MPMIMIQDEIHLPASAVAEVRALLTRDYLPGAEIRGLSLTGQWLSPPARVEGVDTVLWWQWQLPDPMHFYGQRAGQDDSVTRFWQAVDALVHRRQRHVMVAADSELPGPLASADLDEPVTDSHNREA